MHDCAEGDEAGIAIDHPGAWFPLGLGRGEGVEVGLLAHGIEEHRDPVPESGRVREQGLDRDLCLESIGPKLGQDLADRLVEPNPVIGNQFQDRRRGRRHLGQGGKIEDRIDPHRGSLILRLAHGPTGCSVETDFAPASDERDGAAVFVAFCTFDKRDPGVFNGLAVESKINRIPKDWLHAQFSAVVLAGTRPATTRNS